MLIGNHQVKNGNNGVGYSLDSKWHPFTIMSADFDFDNEPDYCLQFQFRDGTPRPGIQPVRFDFLPVVELGLALRHDNKAYAIGIFVPQGHFEVTETAFMRTTQFEYDGFQSYTDKRIEDKSPVIINGGEYEMFVVRYHDSNRTSYFLLGGNAWIHRFAPGAHPSNASPKIYLCPINVIGGQVKELYLTGLYRAELAAPTNQGAPRCYTDGGKFDIMTGAGYEKVEAGSNVTFKINHSKITEFYGGGINANRPVTGNINITINNSKVKKYCGGPKLGDMSNTKSIITNASGTTFDEFYGGGNGGTNLLRDRQYDAGAGVAAPTQSDHSHWDNAAKFTAFTPFSYTSEKGYQAEYEFEMLPRTSGTGNVITRSYYHWASFAMTKVAPITNTITDCIFNGNFYGGGNLGAVDIPANSTDPAISSTLKGNTIVHGSVFGAGYSASATSFKVHDKTTVVYPYRDNAGFIHDGSLDYEKISADPLVYKEYIWIHNIPNEWGITPVPSTSNPTFIYKDKWYVYTPVDLTGLGAVNGNVTLTITDDTIIEGKVFDKDGNVIAGEMGGVYGGGDESAVKKKTGVADSGNTTVNLQGNTVVYGNVYGGGNQGNVEGSTEVNIR